MAFTINSGIPTTLQVTVTETMASIGVDSCRGLAWTLLVVWHISCVEIYLKEILLLHDYVVDPWFLFGDRCMWPR